MFISSLDNSMIKYLLKLKQKKYRDLYNEYIVEGLHLVKEAYKSKVVKKVIILKGRDNPFEEECLYVSEEVMKKLSDLDSFSDIIALCVKKEMKEITGDKILLLDKIQDPGNLGTIIRSSKAFNVDTLVLSSDSVDLYNSKVLRATQGIYNYLNIVKMPLEEAIGIIKNKNIPLYGTDVNQGRNVKELSKKEKERFALIMGNEGQGLNPQYKKRCDSNLYIPINSDVESLNVATASSILLYELNGE